MSLSIHKTKVVVLLWLGFVTGIKATPMIEEMKGQDLVNAAKLVLGAREGDNLTDEQKLMSLYALGFIESMIVSDSLKVVTVQGAQATFDFGNDGEERIFQMIFKFVDGSPTLSQASGAQLMHGLMCMRYGRTAEIRAFGSKVVMGLAGNEAKKITEAMELMQKKDERKAGETSSADTKVSEADAEEP